VIEPGLFKDLTSLKKLILRVNELSDIHINLFSELSNLEELDLSQNSISHIHLETFRPLINLKSLNLEKNFLKKFDFNCLAGLSELNEVILEKNFLMDIDLKSLNRLRIKKVRLNGNPGFRKVKMVNGSVVIEYSKISLSGVGTLKRFGFITFGFSFLLNFVN